MGSLVYYIMQDEQVADCVKIGKDTLWPNRFRDARSHTPGRIKVRYTFEIPEISLSEQSLLDTKIDNALAEALGYEAGLDLSVPPAKTGNNHPLILKGPKEWYRGTADFAAKVIQGMPEFMHALIAKNPGMDQKLSGTQITWDDWRDTKTQNKAMAAFLYQIRDRAIPTGHPHVGRLKITATSLYDSAYKNKFTYNPFRVFMIGGFQMDCNLSEDSIAENNRRVLNAWEEILKDCGCWPFRQPMGWLPPTTTPKQVLEIMLGHKLVPFDLLRPKPSYVRKKDPGNTSYEKSPYSHARCDNSLYENYIAPSRPKVIKRKKQSLSSKL